mgnify:CR=1 FL=1
MELQYTVAGNFLLNGTAKKIIPYGNGHINDTFLVEADSKYILQRINDRVFERPLEVISNIEKVLEHISENIKDKRESLSFVKTKTGKNYFLNESGCWRMYDFIENAFSPERIDSPEEFYRCAKAFGTFQKQLADFPAEELFETIPDFHNTPKRFERFMTVLSKDKFGRAKNAEKEIEFAKKHESLCHELYNAFYAGKLPLRVTHNDTKCNNIMLDSTTGNPLCVIDLDTVMPGFSVNDFGDSIRFGAATAAEDEPDTDKMTIDLALFEAFCRGFAEGTGGLLTKDEMRLMPVGAKMMTFECGMRFLTDYLEGNVYFKTKYEEHNLVRCRTQFRLLSEMEKHWDEMIRINEKYC